MKYQFKFILGMFLANGLVMAAPTTPPKTPIVFTDTIRSSELFDTLTYPARLSPTINATLLAETEGIVSRIVAPLGKQVSKGQTLLSLRNTDPVYDYAPLNVKAPVAGIISSVDVTEGTRVMKGQKIATITDPEKVFIVIEIAASDLGTIRAAMKGELTIPGQAPIGVEVTGVSPFVDPATGSATAQLKLVEKEKAASLPPGLIGRVSFRAREHKGIQIPEFALTYKGETPFARVVDKGKAKFISVELGQSRRGLVEVLKGLEEGATLILRANSFVADGEEVIVQAPGSKSE